MKIFPFVEDDQKYIFLINLWFFIFHQEFYTPTVNVKLISATKWDQRCACIRLSIAKNHHHFHYLIILRLVLDLDVMLETQLPIY